MKTALRKALPLLLCLILCLGLTPAALAAEADEILITEDYEPYLPADDSVTFIFELSDAEVFDAAGDIVTISFDANGGTGTMAAQEFVRGDAAKPLNPNTFTRDGYYFLGWNERADGTAGGGRIINNGAAMRLSEASSSSALTLYAQWAKKVIVHFDPNGASGAKKGQTLPQSVPAKLAAMEKIGYTREGYEFAGWAPVPDAAPDDPRIIPDNGEFTADGETTLYAVWLRDLWWAVGYTFDEVSNGSGMIRLTNGSTTLSSVSNVRDSNGNIIIKPNGTNSWLVRDGTETALTLTVMAASGNTTYIRLNDGEYSALSDRQSFELGTVTGQMIYTVAFIRNTASPKSDILLHLPDSVSVIEDEAFAGGAFIEVWVPAQVTAIGSRAFAGCPNLERIHILGSTTEIAEDAFENVDGLTIIGKFQSAAIAFAKEHRFAYIITG